MDWINDFTTRWKLKNSFFLYMFIFSILAISMSYVVENTLLNYRFNYISTVATQAKEINLWGNLVLSKVYQFMIDVSLLVHLLGYLAFAFWLFYKHKIEINIKTIQFNKDIYNDNQDELAYACGILVENLQETENLNIKNALEVNKLAKKMDTLLHELKNPLSILKGDIDLLDILIKNEQPEVKEIINRLKRTENRIEKYIGRLSQQQTLREIKVFKKNQSLEKVRGKILEIDKDKDIELLFIKDINNMQQNIRIDIDLFIEAINNILDNAFRFADSKVSVKLTEDLQSVYFIIRDDGVGFSKEALDNYAYPYYSENTIEGNMGLGLYISKILLEKQNISYKVSNINGAIVTICVEKN